MELLNSKKGSEWRRWDLHIHTPETKLSNCYQCDGDIWDEYIDFIENSSVRVFGITDYFSADGYFKLTEKYHEKYPDSEKVFFPNIEFRLVEAISAENGNPHIHVIFDNDKNICSKELITRFLSSLKTLGESDSGARISCAELQSDSQYESASVSIEDLKSSLKEVFGETEPYLLAFPAKNDGVRSTDSNSPRKMLITDKIDKSSHLFFGDSGSRSWFLKCDRYENGESKPKPVVSGSDAHSFLELERLEGNVSGFEPTWIKADLTFRGLKQICFEPDSRVYIGAEPEVETRKANQATKFLTELKIDQCASYGGINGHWFKDVSIQLNPELVVIIGNKGSGKSALVDIVGLLGDSRQEEYFSFLSNKGNNKKFRQRGYAENFEAKMLWQSGSSAAKKLDESIDRTNPETVRYLPQNYFEKLTNEIEIGEFRREIEDVVFSHVEETDRMGKETFEGLQEFKTQQSKHETSSLKARLRELNIEIIDLEEQSDPIFKKKMEGELKAKRDELVSLDSAKPVEQTKPDEETPEQKELTETIEKLLEKKNELSSAERECVVTLTEKKERMQKLTALFQSVSLLGKQVESQKAELMIICNELGLDIEVIITSGTNVEPINDQIAIVQAEIKALENDNQLDFDEITDFTSIVSLPNLRAAIEFVSNQVNALKEKLGTPQRKYQAYLEKLAKWNTQRNDILGDVGQPKLGTIKYLEDKIAYIENELSPNLDQCCKDRKEIVEKIFVSKKQILMFYSELKSSVEDKLSSVRTDDFSVEIDASFLLDRSFNDDFLKLINKTRRGFFHGANDPQKRLKSLIGEVDWNDFESIYTFFETALEKMSTYEKEPISIREQCIDTKEFYDFMFSLEYFSAKYELRLGGKNLNELSPGEKGLLLLVFYLQLDRDNIPLVIDQPEDNLDNDSIFAVLAQCIREAKKNRQVILVTHNPNLAVGADAEQIIYVKLAKAENYKFTYETGAIENPQINERIVKVLEGSQPAFVKRRLKYQI